VTPTAPAAPASQATRPTGPVTGSAVITGVGVVAPSGMTAAEHWATVTERTSKVGPITLFDATPYRVRLAGEVRDFDAGSHVPGRLSVQTDRWTWLSFAAAAQAIGDARLDLQAMDPYDVAVAMASSSGGNGFGQRELQKLWSQPARKVGAYQSIAWFYAATVGQLSILHQAKGPSTVLVAEAAGGLDSIIHAAKTVARGTPVVLSGGIEAPLTPYALTCQLRTGWLSQYPEPALAYRPFDAGACGYVPGEGGAVLIVEDAAHARARGVAGYAEIAGWGCTHDGRRPARGGDPAQYARAMRLALDRAGLGPVDVDVLIPDALGVPDMDRAEADAIGQVFGARRVPVTSHKALTGRLYQGGAALDVVTALLAMRTGQLPAMAGVERPAAGCALAFVPATGAYPVRTALVCARGFDGYNTCLVLRDHRAAAAAEQEVSL
jgi:minimal PKS chain-length factor (CLF/KS beta)